MEDGEIRATYPRNAIRFSVVRKATVRNGALDASWRFSRRTSAIEAWSTMCCQIPLADTVWILLLQRIYADPTAVIGG